MNAQELAKYIGNLLFDIKQQINDIIILKKLVESNIVVKDPVDTINLVYKQLVITQVIVNKSYDKIISSLTEVVKEPETPVVKPVIKEQPTEETIEENPEDFIDTDYQPEEPVQELNIKKKMTNEELKNKIAKL
jgi:hypothetical protein